MGHNKKREKLKNLNKQIIL
jgi:hypothetical protein